MSSGDDGRPAAREKMAMKRVERIQKVEIVSMRYLPRISISRFERVTINGKAL
jgi:hypothetical protein